MRYRKRWLKALSIVVVVTAGCSGGEPAKNFGLVLVSSQSLPQGGAPVATGAAGAQFVEFANTYADGFRNCPKQAIGECVVSVCQQCDPSSPSSCPERGPVNQNANAGTVTIGGADTAIMLAFDPTAGYAGFMQANTLWQGGEPITFHADGAEVPRFDTNVTAPSQVSLVSPNKPAMYGSLMQSRAMDLALTWNGGGAAGSLHIKLEGANRAQAAAVLIDCFFPLNAGSAAVPAGVWSMFDTTFVSVDAIAVGHAVTTVGGWEITTEAQSPVTWADGTPASADITLQ